LALINQFNAYNKLTFINFMQPPSSEFTLNNDCDEVIMLLKDLIAKTERKIEQILATRRDFDMECTKDTRKYGF